MNSYYLHYLPNGRYKSQHIFRWRDTKTHWLRISMKPNSEKMVRMKNMQFILVCCLICSPVRSTLQSNSRCELESNYSTPFLFLPPLLFRCLPSKSYVVTYIPVGTLLDFRIDVTTKFIIEYIKWIFNFVNTTEKFEILIFHVSWPLAFYSNAGTWIWYLKNKSRTKQSQQSCSTTTNYYIKMSQGS